ncbi:MAG: hypothetical protein JST16_06505 [Bdellovibrionales bacterium]|nr:hypothetical protein [Bdellovibrionales bacterium]
MARHPKGTSPKLTAKVIERIAASIRSGCYVETAVALEGLSKQSFYRWLKQAESDDATELTQKLSDAVKKAMAAAELRDLAVIDRAAQQGEWTAAAWRLERKHPERWGRQARIQHEHTGAGGGPIEVVHRTENIKRILSDASALDALEVIEGKLLEGGDEEGC